MHTEQVEVIPEIFELKHLQRVVVDGKRDLEDICKRRDYLNIKEVNLKKALEDAETSIRRYTCPSCGTQQDRDKNACANLLKWYETTRATWESEACGDDVSPCATHKAIVYEAGKIAGSELQAPSFREG